MSVKFAVRVEGGFESAHFLYNYYPNGDNEELHGHSFKVELFCASKTIKNGISVDFIFIKKLLDEVVIKLDHKCLNNLSAFQNINPTAENIAIYIETQIKEKLPENTKITEIIVWEGPVHHISYFPPAS
ncbi:MAG: 6-carboxytetrahydropterin synthase [Spirochaetia bacterium]|nr:6-carboxytetrahydropterin synthase [Spirochaetia bacterium]